MKANPLDRAARQSLARLLKQEAVENREERRTREPVEPLSILPSSFRESFFQTQLNNSY